MFRQTEKKQSGGNGNSEFGGELRFLLVTVVAAATIGLAAGNAGARDLSLPHKPFAKMTTTEKVSWLKRQIHKDASVVSFWKNHRFLASETTMLNPVTGLTVAAQAGLDVQWARTSMRIAQNNMKKLMVVAHAARHVVYVGGSVPQTICSVFGSYCSQALAVARCESGYNVNAVNGQYLGIFQMGEHERATYGHGPDAYTQARAAYSYFVASGRDWSPWSCKP